MDNKHEFNDEWLVKVVNKISSVTPDVIDHLRIKRVPYLSDALIESSTVNFEMLGKKVRDDFRIPYLTLEKNNVDKLAFSLVPEKVCRKYQLIPFKVNSNNIEVLTWDPLNIMMKGDVEAVTGRTFLPYFGLYSNIQTLLTELFNPDQIVFDLLSKFEENTFVEVIGIQAEKVKDVESSEVRLPIIKLVNVILSKAVKMRASDIHIEQEEKETVVRYRIDGYLKNIMTLPKYIGSTFVVARIKVMAELDLADHRRPQDGRTKIIVGSEEIDLRISVLPTLYGEKIVLRLLNPKSSNLNIDKMGFSTIVADKFKSILTKPQGMILVTGPTGSGKTTTLYAVLNTLKTEDTNIVTIEDPIEYRLAGINQVNVNEKQGLTFASALRSILRQDPDIILVGEIRDLETAEIAFQSAMTGHLVLSTLHTNDAVSTVVRLVDMGIESFKIATPLIAVTSQRLVRKLCPECKTLVPENEKDPVVVKALTNNNLKPDYYKPGDCAACDFTGFRGRFSVVEVFDINSEMKKYISEGTQEEELRKLAIEKNMLWTMTEDALVHLVNGDSSLDELLPYMTLHDRIIIGDLPKGHNENQEAAAKKRILIADDDPSIRMLLSKYLENSGYKVLIAQDGVEAVGIISKTVPDLLILDLMMPKMDGFSVINKVRIALGLIKLPIIVLTAKSDEESQVNVMNIGANDYLIKPFNPKILISRVDAVFRRLAQN
ncbi:MAG: ATPase, T2SS/T4P/T4SS family [Elusimicrobiota bacterium]